MALAFVVNSDTQLTAVAPAQAAATVDLMVTTPSGTYCNSQALFFSAAAPGAFQHDSLHPRRLQALFMLFWGCGR